MKIARIFTGFASGGAGMFVRQSFRFWDLNRGSCLREGDISPCGCKLNRDSERIPRSLLRG
jgi:hypothetical protein